MCNQCSVSQPKTDSFSANFALPEKGDIFQEITYPELQEEEAKALVAKYNKEGNDAGYFSNAQQSKRFRADDNRDRRDFRGGNGDGDRGRQDNRGRNEPWRDRGYSNNRRRRKFFVGLKFQESLDWSILIGVVFFQLIIVEVGVEAHPDKVDGETIGNI